MGIFKVPKSIITTIVTCWVPRPGEGARESSMHVPQFQEVGGGDGDMVVAVKFEWFA